MDDRAYELKIRVTIAASGQGRWQEELNFPVDAKESGFVPVLVCMDGTPNPKLDALIRAFNDSGGESYVGDTAWTHLDDMAGPTMSKFLDRYVRAPIQHLINADDSSVPNLRAVWMDNALTIEVDGDSLTIPRDPNTFVEVDESEGTIPEDADDEIPG